MNKKQTRAKTKKKIVITGGAGFIGSHITDACVKAGFKVIVLDSLKSGKKENINPRASFYKADIRNAAMINKIFKKEKPDIVSHHAAIAEIAKSLRNPEATAEVNILGTLNVLQASAASGVKKIIFASTGGAIYGDPKKLPVSEEDPTSPISIYGLSKFFGEELVKYYARIYGFDYVIFRYSNVYGPRQNPNGEAGVVAIFGGLMKRNKRPFIFGDGSKTRDYTYVYDIVSAHMLGLSSNKANNQILNLGRGISVKDSEIYDLCASSCNFSKTPIYKPFRKGEVAHINLDPRKASQLLGWQPKIKLKDGIKETIAIL